MPYITTYKPINPIAADFTTKTAFGQRPLRADTVEKLACGLALDFVHLNLQGSDHTRSWRERAARLLGEIFGV
jgi:hypothetical protein